MEITADLVKFDLLKGVSPTEIFENLFEDDDQADDIFVLSAGELPGGWSDSVRLYGQAGDGLGKYLVGAVAEVTRNCLRDGYARLLLPKLMPDELGLRTCPDEHYIGSFAPSTAHSIFNYMKKTSKFWIEGSKPSSACSLDIDSYLEQWKVLVESAYKKDLGVLIHMG